ncbi:MAG: HK97 family phage prohead protease [Pseudomonadota bacterium]
MHSCNSEKISGQSASRSLELKFAQVSLRTVEADGTFDGYASLFDTPDLGRDIVKRGAFAASLKRRGPGGVRMLFQHDPNQPIGVWQEIREDARGLHVTGRLSGDVVRAQEIFSLMREGALDGLSIGYRTIKGTRDPATRMRILHIVDLWEISIVTFPMQPDARVDRVKHHPFRHGLPSKRQFERWLTRDAGLTRSQARALLVGGYSTLAAKLAAAGGDDTERELVAAMARARTLLDPARRRKFI